MPPGHCTLPPDEAGRILDRLTGLEQIIPPEAVRQALQATGRINPRSCQLTHEVICWVVLAMGILTELPIRGVFKHARRLRFGEETPHRSSLCVARRRLGIAPVRHLFEQVVLCLRYYTVSFRGRPPAHVWVTGGGAEGADVCELARLALGLPVEPLPLMAGLPLGPLVALDNTPPLGEWAVAYGLALRGVPTPDPAPSPLEVARA